MGENERARKFRSLNHYCVCISSGADAPLSNAFFTVAKACTSVISYRCTPMQKSLLVTAVAERSAIG